MSESFDIAIVGAGISGLTALSCALKKNLKTALIFRDFGASQYMSGAFDVIDPRLLNPELVCEQFDLGQTVSDFCKVYPQHILSQIVKSGSSHALNVSAEIKNFLEFFSIPHVGDGQQGVWALSSTGFFKPTALALQGQAWTSETWRRFKRIVVLGFQGVFEYSAERVTLNLRHQGFEAQAREITHISTHPASPYVSVLRALQNEDVFQNLCAEIRHALLDADCVVLPPVLNADFSQRVFREFKGQIVEMLSSAPSVSADRFLTHIKRGFTQNHVTCVQGEVLPVEFHDQAHLEKISVETSTGIVTVKARSWIVATGKFLGGGIEHKNDVFREPLFDTPLTLESKDFKAETHMTQLIQKEAQKSQLFLKLGVALQPNQKFKNQAFCGHILSGFDFTREHCGVGVSVASAHYALRSLGVL